MNSQDLPSRERKKVLYTTFGEYAIVGPEPIETIRSMVTEMSQLGWKLEKIFYSNTNRHIAYLELKPDPVRPRMKKKPIYKYG